MAIAFADNFSYFGAKPNFERDSYATLADMVSTNENYLPNVFIGVCEETGKAYLFNKSNEVDPTLGKWREIVGGTDITDYIRKTEDFSTFEPMYYGEIAQYIGQTNQNYTHGYFYKAIPHFAYSNIQFTPSGDYEIEVSISDEDLTTFFNEEFIPTDSPFVSGQFGYRQTNPEVLWSFSPETETHEFRSHLGTPEQYAESGFTVTPPIGPSQGLTFTVDHSTTYTYEQINVQPQTDLVWGNITGTLSEQTDLQNALDAKQDTLTAGTNITIEEDAQTGDLVISSTSQESFFRGKWATWTSVPTDTSRYPEDYNHNRIPTENDYMVVTDTSDYTAEGMEIKIYWDGWETHQFSVNDSALVRMNGVSTWTPFNLENDVIIYIKDFEPSYGHFGIKCNVDMLVNGSIVPAGNVVEFIESAASRTVYYYVAGGATLSGTWRFAYHGVWSSIGKNGWLPEYQLEEVLPIASPTEQGITKLYNTTGTNTDGAVDQNTVTSELGKRVLQVTEFPEASASNEGQLVQFIGTGGSGTTGWFYTSTQYQIPYSLTVEGDSDVTVTTYDTETYLSQLSDTTVDSTTVFTYDGTDWKDSDSNVVDLTDWGITISGTPVDNSTITGTYVAPSTGYRWVQTDTQPTEEYHESFFRGPFGTWTNVPDVGHEDQYYADFYGNHRPGLTDYIVVANPEDYVSEETEVIHLTTTSTGGSTASMNVTILSTGQTEPYLYHDPGSQSLQWKSIPDTDFYIAYGITETGGKWGIKNISSPFTVDGRVYPVGSVYTWAYNVTLDKPVNSYPVYRGMWRFAYTSNSWDSDGKNGWKPEYQIENVLPIADSQTLGIAKLYTTTGQNTDGSVTQKLVTTELGKKQDTLTPGTGIDISTDASTGKLVISSTSSESFYRGTFATWTLVPTNPTNYVEDPVHHLKTPTNTDYMIVTDASDYYKPGAEITIQLKGYVGGTGYVLELSGEWSDTLIAYNTPYERVYGNNELIINFDSHDGQWSWRVRFNIPVVLNGVRYDAYDVWTGASGGGTRVFNEIVDQPCEGTWRFGYYGEWDTAGRNGWVAEYKIEDTLPIATDQEPGIMKLYTTTGSNTDGTMDQSSITIELGNKQDLLTNASNAGEGIIIDDVTQEISTNNIVWRKW